MKQDFTVFAVDDDPMALDLIGSVLAGQCLVETFPTVEACKARLEETKPDMFLLDVRMPGINGYDFCREIKDDYHLRTLPVTFVSSQDTIEARLTGYDAGGDDFIVKPFAAEELERKVRVARQFEQNASQIRQQLDDAEMLSSLVMANMDEYAVLVRFLRELLSCEDETGIANCTLDMIRRYNLDGAIQVRTRATTITISPRGTNQPLEESVLGHVRGMDRIFEFKNRGVHNFEHITLMINNLPLHDPEYCGRLRDHLCIALESAEARIQAIETESANNRKDSGIRHVLERIQSVTSGLTQAYLKEVTATSELMLRLEQALAKSFVSLGLTDDQEHELSDTISRFSEEMVHILDSGAEAHAPLRQISHELNQLIGHSD